MAGVCPIKLKEIGLDVNGLNGQHERSMETLIPTHGGYRNLKTFQIARLIFDITHRFCNRFIDKKSRTHDQMVQAARSGVQNIAEGSQASGTSKKTELKLTNVARASLEELRLDYEDFLRQNRFSVWGYHDLRRKEIIDARFTTADQFALWTKAVHERTKEPLSAIAANGILVLIEVVCLLLSRQLKYQAEAFQKEGGFTERLYKMRKKMQ